MDPDEMMNDNGDEAINQEEMNKPMNEEWRTTLLNQYFEKKYFYDKFLRIFTFIFLLKKVRHFKSFF